MLLDLTENSFHYCFVKLGSKFTNSALVASVNLFLAVVVFLSFMFPRFANWGFGLVPVTVTLLVIAGCFFVRDLWKAGTRLRAVFALLLSLPVVALYMMLAVWEGPLYVSVTAAMPPRFCVQGPSGLQGLEIYGPDRQRAEWIGDDIGLIWGFEWTNAKRFPPKQVEFSYGQTPAGFGQEAALGEHPTPSLLDPNLTYMLSVSPGMGMPENFLLVGTQLTPYKPDPKVCWGQLLVLNRPAATVRVDCITRKPLPMSQRANDRLKAYQEGRIPFF
jgi:hypothetical protein